MKKIILCSYLFSCILAWSDAPAPSPTPTPPPTNSSAGNAVPPQPQSEENIRFMEIVNLIEAIAHGGDKSQAAWDAIETKIEAYQKDFGAKPEVTRGLDIMRNSARYGGEPRFTEILGTIEAIAHGGDKSQAAWDALEAKIEAFQKDFNAKPHGMEFVLVLRAWQLDIVQKFADPTLYAALQQKLLKDPIPEMASVVKDQIDEMKLEELQIAVEKKMEGLKKNPVDLKFTAVDGSAFDLATMRGKVVLIDFWATWDRPCLAEVPNVVAAYKKYHDQGFEIVGISLDEDKAALLAFTEQNGMVWPQYFDGARWDNKISRGFGIGLDSQQSIPVMWLVDKKGMLVTTNGRDDLAGQVEKLLQAGKTAAGSSTNTTVGQ